MEETGHFELRFVKILLNGTELGGEDNESILKLVDQMERGEGLERSAILFRHPLSTVAGHLYRAYVYVTLVTKIMRGNK